MHVPKANGGLPRAQPPLCASHHQLDERPEAELGAEHNSLDYEAGVLYEEYERQRKALDDAIIDSPPGDEPAYNAVEALGAGNEVHSDKVSLVTVAPSQAANESSSRGNHTGGQQPESAAAEGEGMPRTSVDLEMPDSAGSGPRRKRRGAASALADRVRNLNVQDLDVLTKEILVVDEDAGYRLLESEQSATDTDNSSSDESSTGSSQGGSNDRRPLAVQLCTNRLFLLAFFSSAFCFLAGSVLFIVYIISRNRLKLDGF